MKILHVAGARPNFMKIAPLMKAFEGHPQVEQRLVHTGQHYDDQMSRVFFEELGLPRPDINLEIGSASHAVQTARIMMALEPLIPAEQPDLVLVVGDVNSTLAAALVCAKLHVPVAHVEAGLRSFDRTMPEEVNRVLTDRLSELLFVTERSAIENLRREGIPEERVHFVGNVMIDTLMSHLHRARELRVREALGLGDPYVLVTLHRPSNVDDAERFGEIATALAALARQAQVVFPVHPRTLARLREFGLERGLSEVRLIEPLGYLDFLGLMDSAALVLTDSGGIQEETTVLGVPCLTVRESTERPVTVEQGTNRLVTILAKAIIAAALEALEVSRGEHRLPELWDGKAAERIARVTRQWWLKEPDIASSSG